MTNYSLVEKGMEHKRNQSFSFGSYRPMMWALELWKGTSLDEVMLDSEEIKPVAI